MLFMNGAVYLIGAGPGDPDLLTLKAVKALEKAHSISETELAAAAKDGMPNIPGMDMFK